MKTTYKYIHFEEIDSTGLKTSVWKCANNKSLSYLGIVKWYPAWRQYCFSPFENTIFNKGCLEDVNDFITQLMEDRK